MKSRKGLIKNSLFRSNFFYNFNRSPIAIISFIFVLLLSFLAIFANFIAPSNPFDSVSLNLMNGFTPPLEPNQFTNETFILGTDDQGRDLLSTIIYGLRVSLFVGISPLQFIVIIQDQIAACSMMSSKS